MNQALPRAQSFSDLRGYTKQTVGSHSEFGGVAEHLHYSNPGLNGRLAWSQVVFHFASCM